MGHGSGEVYRILEIPKGVLRRQYGSRNQSFAEKEKTQKEMTPAEQFAVNTYPHDTFPGEFGDSLRAACAVGFVAGQKENGLLKKVREMRDAQLEFDRTRITGWRYKVQRLGAEIDKTLKELGVETSIKKTSVR